MASAVDLPSTAPQLPAEIWRMVFGNLDTTDQDLIHLWLNYRLVSRFFKEEAEHAFANKFVSKTSLYIGSCRSLSRHGSQSAVDTGPMSTPRHPIGDTAAGGISSHTWWAGLTYSGSFTFEKFSERGDQAVFHCDWPPNHITGLMFQTLQDQELLRHVMKKPCHEVRMRQRGNNIPLPDLVLNDKELTLALDWRQLISRFLAKEKCSN